MHTNGNQPVVPKLQYNIPHIRQKYRWDCGVACVLMLLPDDDRKLFQRNFTEICQEEGFGRNTWTIDLCYLLKRFNIKHSMYTTRQAPSMKSLNKLHKNVIVEAQRVTMRFATAGFHGIKVYDGLLCMRDLISHVSNVGPAIVLVNADLLSCDWCKRNKLTYELRRMLGGTYQGHYIVVSGWLSKGSKLVYLDPARRAPLCATSPARLHAARPLRATDCDVILLQQDYTSLYMSK